MHSATPGFYHLFLFCDLQSVYTAPTSRRLNVMVRSPLLLRVVGRNGETTTPEGSDHPVAPNRLDLPESLDFISSKYSKLAVITGSRK